MKKTLFVCSLLYIIVMTAYPIPQNQVTPVEKIINHTNFDCDGYNESAIIAAKKLKVYFEHASTGQDIFGDSNSDSTTGTKDNAATGNCGLALLCAINGAKTRYVIPRSHFESNLSGSFDTNKWDLYKAEWFTTGAGKDGGLQTNKRSNPASKIKVSGFSNLPAAIINAIDVAMFKFCWVDCWGTDWTDSAPISHSDPKAFANFVIQKTELLQAKKPSLTIVYWTMPLQKDSDDTKNSYRDAYNIAIRNYCKSNNKWLMDMADIECHNEANAKRTSIGCKELAYENYCSDTGHLSNAGALKMAKAYWSLLVNIAKSKS